LPVGAFAFWLYGWIPFDDGVCVALQLYLVLLSAPLYPKDKPAEDPAPVVKAVEGLLKANGYEVPPRFQTRKAGLDQLIAVLDLVAYGGGNGLAFQFKTGGPDAPAVTWSEASTMRSATWAIYKAAEEHGFGIDIDTIRPVMVLAGRRADPSLTAF